MKAKLLLLLMPFLVSTSCVFMSVVKVEYDLSPCPIKEFTLPIHSIFEGTEVKLSRLEGVRDYEVQKIKSEDYHSSIYSKEWRVSSLITVGFQDNCRLTILSQIPDSSKTYIISKPQEEQVKEAFDHIAETLLSKTKFKSKRRKTDFYIKSEEAEKIQDSFVIDQE